MLSLCPPKLLCPLFIYAISLHQRVEGRFTEANNTVPQQGRKNHAIIIKISESTQHNKTVPFAKREESQEVLVKGSCYN